MCCNGELLDSEIYLCCEDMKHKKETQNDQCCGTQMYDPAIRSCFESRFVGKLAVYGHVRGKFVANKGGHLRHKAIRSPVI